MRFLVVLFALVAVAVAAPATNEAAAGPGTAKKRSIGHVGVAYAVPSAVSHYSGVNVHSSPTVVAAPLEYSVVSGPVAARTVAVAPAVYSAHQSSVNLHHSPAVVATPVVSQQVVSAPAVVDARSVYSPVAAVYSAPSAVSHQSHQSQVSVHSSPALVSHQVSPAVYSSSVYSPSVYSPSVYSPSVYSPSVYSPSVYSSYW